MNRLASVIVFLALVLPGLATADHNEKSAAEDPIKKFCGEHFPALSINDCLQKICERQYSDGGAIRTCVDEYEKARLKHVQAQQAQEIEKIQAGQQQILRGVTDIGKTLEAFKSSPPPSASATRVTPAASATSTPSPAVANRTIVQNASAQIQTSFVGGAPYQVMARQSLVSIYSLAKMEPDTLHVKALSHSSSMRKCGGTGQGMLIVTNHGIPVPVWAPAGVPSGFVEIYADLDGNGQPDPLPYKALDTKFQTGFYVTWRTGDELLFTYLRDSGQVIAVPGLPIQTVWRRPSKEDGTPIGCETDVTDKPGGHRAGNLYDLGRVW